MGIDTFKISFKVRCEFCRNADCYIMLWEADEEDMYLYSIDTKKPKQRKFISYEEMHLKLEKFYEDKEFECNYCGRNFLSQFWEIKINEVLLEKEIWDFEDENVVKGHHEQGNLFVGRKELKTDIQKMNLLGKVKSINEISYLADFDKHDNLQPGDKQREDFSIFSVLKNETRDFTYVFNENGNLIQEIYYSEDDIEETCIYKRDIQENIKEKEIKYMDEEKNNKIIYKYDKNGKLTQEVFHSSEGKIINVTKITYAPKRRLMNRTKYGSDGKLIEKSIHKYDEYNNMIEKLLYDSEGVLKGKFVYEFDENNILIKYTEHEYVSIKYTKNEYSENLSSMLPRASCQLLYDNNGNIIEEIWILFYKHVKYRYRYDWRGNWIWRIQIPGGDWQEKPEFIVERNIEYFNKID